MVSNSNQDNVVVTTTEKYVSYPCSITQLDQKHHKKRTFEYCSECLKNLANQTRNFKEYVKEDK